ncbi:MAG: hypothetical protein K8R92_09380 [Planctomycetes bacterium]|nr:hypothetical protein [Planctomycetota bacterium]
MARHRDEGPSEEDLRRYGVDAPDAESAVVYCPDCGSEMHPDAEICPKCFCFIEGQRLRRPPLKERTRRARTVLIVLLLVAAMLLPLLAWLRW